jgi:hypothetical protein
VRVGALPVFSSLASVRVLMFRILAVSSRERTKSTLVFSVMVFALSNKKPPKLDGGLLRGVGLVTKRRPRISFRGGPGTYTIDAKTTFYPFLEYLFHSVAGNGGSVPAMPPNISYLLHHQRETLHFWYPFG